MATAKTSQASTPFVSRELNGEVLLSELTDLRSAGVSQSELNQWVLTVRELAGAPATMAASRLKHHATQAPPALGAIFKRWATRLRADADVEPLLAHFDRLAITAGIVGALRRAASQAGR